MLDSVEPFIPTPRPRKEKPLAPVKSSAAPVKSTPAPATNQKIASDERKARVLEHLRVAGDFVRGADLARTMGEEQARVAHSLVLLARDGLAISNGVGGKGCAYRAVGRQTGKAKAKPRRGADEEEGARVEPPRIREPRLLGPVRHVEPDVKLSIVSPIAPVPPAPQVRRAPVREGSGVFRLPVFLLGEGERHEHCANYGDCLGRFARRYPSARAHCPPGCASFTEIPAHVRHGIAMTGGVSALAHAAETK